MGLFGFGKNILRMTYNERFTLLQHCFVKRQV